MAELGSAVFLSWVRGSLAQKGTAAAAGGLPRLTANVDVTVSSGATTEAVPARFDLYGPADVGGISASQVLRTDPKAGEPAAEPNYLCLIEFDAPELPWALSPGVPDQQEQVQPWLALVVVPDEPGRIQQRSGSSLPLLRCPGALLPDCSEAWAWAHAQVVPVGGRSVDDILADRAAGGATLSRLICPTKLEPTTSYVACVVPTFDAGVRVQTGKDVSGAGSAPAWGPDGEAALPVYYSWRFRTGVTGDFEDAARLLHPVEADKVPGLGRSDLSMAAEAIPGVAAVAELPALRTLLTTATEADRMDGEAVPADVQARLADIVSPDAAPAAVPMVQPPAYGRWPAQIDHLDADTGGWIGTLNRSPAHRIVARLGGDLIRTQQEELVAEARRQAGEYARARAARDWLRLAQVTSARLYTRRLTDLDQSRLIATARPAHADVVLPTGASVAAEIANSTVDPALLGRSMARVSARAARQMQVGEQAVRREVVAGTFAGAFAPRPVAEPVLTDQVDRLRDVYTRAGLLDQVVGSTTLGGLIEASALVAGAETVLAEQLDTVPLVFAEPPPVDPGDVIDPHVVDVNPNIVDLDPDVVGPHVIDIGHRVVDEIDPHIVDIGRRAVDDIAGNAVDGIDEVVIGQRHRLDPTRRHIERDGLNPIGEPVDDNADVVEVLRRLARRRGDFGRLGGEGGFEELPAVSVRALDDQSAATVTSMLDAAASPVAAALGAADAVAVDVSIFTLDDTTAELGRQFRERVTGEPAAATQVSSAALLRARLGLPVAAPVRRESLSTEFQAVFDRAVLGVSASVLTPALAYPAGAVARLAASDVAGACLTGLEPRATHTVATSRVLTRDRLAVLLSPVELLLGFVPTFDAPLAARLGRSLNAWILAGAGELPANAVSLVVTNPAFIEAFTVGANHEMAAELLWRDVASDPRGTVFQRFWNTPEIAPIHRWNQPFGHNVDDGKSLVAVVIRSPLLRRYPNTVIYAAQRLMDGEPGFTPDPATIRTVKYQGFIEPDASYSVIDLDVDDARREDAGWFILVSQPVTDARFGLDEWTAAAAPPPPQDWNDLNWGHIPGKRLSPSNAPPRPATAGAVAWGTSAADMAFALHQDPFRVVLPAARYLP